MQTWKKQTPKENDDRLWQDSEIEKSYINLRTSRRA